MEEDVLTPALTGVGDEPVLREEGREEKEAGRGREGGEGDREETEGGEGVREVKETGRGREGGR